MIHVDPSTRGNDYSHPEPCTGVERATHVDLGNVEHSNAGVDAVAAGIRPIVRRRSVLDELHLPAVEHRRP